MGAKGTCANCCCDGCHELTNETGASIGSIGTVELRPRQQYCCSCIPKKACVTIEDDVTAEAATTTLDRNCSTAIDDPILYDGDILFQDTRIDLEFAFKLDSYNQCWICLTSVSLSLTGAVPGDCQAVNDASRAAGLCSDLGVEWSVTGPDGNATTVTLATDSATAITNRQRCTDAYGVLQDDDSGIKNICTGCGCICTCVCVTTIEGGIATVETACLDDTQPAVAGDCVDGQRQTPEKIARWVTTRGIIISLVPHNDLVEIWGGSYDTGLCAGTVAQDATGETWVNPSNALGSTPGTFATCDLTSGQTTNVLELSNFGFAIPTGSRITEIEVRVGKEASVADTIFDARVELIIDGVTGNNRASGCAWPTTENIIIYQESVKRWGFPDLQDSLGAIIPGVTPEDLNDSGFTVRISANDPSGPNAQARISQVCVIARHTDCTGVCEFEMTDVGDVTFSGAESFDDLVNVAIDAENPCPHPTGTWIIDSADTKSISISCQDCNGCPPVDPGESCPCQDLVPRVLVASVSVSGKYGCDCGNLTLSLVYDATQNAWVGSHPTLFCEHEIDLSLTCQYDGWQLEFIATPCTPDSPQTDSGCTPLSLSFTFDMGGAVGCCGDDDLGGDPFTITISVTE